MWYDKNTSTRLSKLPKTVKCAEKGWLLNFDERDTSEIIAEGYVPLTDNVPVYDSAKQTISQSGIVVAGDGNSATIEYTVSDKALDDLKAAKKSQVDAYYRDYSAPHRLVTITVSGVDHTCTCDNETLGNVARKVSSFSFTNSSRLEPLKWYFGVTKTTADLYSEDLKSLSAELEERDQGVRDKRQDHRDQIDALTNADDILAYDHTAGWPS